MRRLLERLSPGMVRSGLVGLCGNRLRCGGAGEDTLLKGMKSSRLSQRCEVAQPQRASLGRLKTSQLLALIVDGKLAIQMVA